MTEIQAQLWNFLLDYFSQSIDLASHRKEMNATCVVHHSSTAQSYLQERRSVHFLKGSRLKGRQTLRCPAVSVGD
jgi:hypothetical protein